MKSTLMAALVMIGLASGIPAQAATEPQILGTAHSIGALGPGTEQTITVKTDGSIHAVLRDAAITSTMDIETMGSSVVITKREPWGVTTTMMDVAAGTRFTDQNPAIAALITKGTGQLNAFRSAHYPVKTSVSPMSAGGAPCDPEAQAVINAGYVAITTCSGGMSLACLNAMNDYNKAVAAYNACVAALSQGHM